MAAVLIQPTDRAIKHYYEQLSAAEGQDALNTLNEKLPGPQPTEIGTSRPLT